MTLASKGVMKRPVWEITIFLLGGIGAGVRGWGSTACRVCEGSAEFVLLLETTGEGGGNSAVSALR